MVIVLSPVVNEMRRREYGYSGYRCVGCFVASVFVIVIILSIKKEMRTTNG